MRNLNFLKKTAKFSLFSFVFLFGFIASIFAHEVTGYVANCAAGPQYSITATVINVNSTSNYRWQYRLNSTSPWVCMVNGANVINGTSYNVTGAVFNLTTTPGPIVFTNPNSGLQGIELRMVISDGSGVNPCTLPAGNTWTNSPGVANHFINVTGTACASTSSCTCPGNLVVNPSFESGTTGWGWSGGNFSAGNGAVACGSFSGDFQITNNASNWVSQTIGTDLAVGTVVNVSVYAGTHDNTFYHDVSISFFDVNWNWLSTSVSVEVNKVLAAAPVGPQLYNLSATVPAGTKYTEVGFGGNGNWIKTDQWCATTTAPVCTGKVTSLYFNELAGGTDLAITNGSTFTVAQLGSLYNLEAGTSGTVGSVKYTITGPTPSSNIENTSPYNSPATSGSAWTGAIGTYSVNLKTYNAADAGGSLCHDTTITFTLTNNSVSLGNQVFIDRNDNGLFESALGDFGYDGATVRLYADNNDDGIADGAAIATQTTSGGGFYNFTGLAAGKYFVQIENVPSWMFKTTVNGGDPDNDINNDNNGLTQNTTTAIIKGGTITLSVGGEPGSSNTNSTYDFGIFKTNGLGDYVFLDANINGIQDAGENGIANVTVRLKNTAGTVLATTTTDGSGYYYFYDPAQYGTYTYTIEFVTPAGYSASPANQGSDDAKDSDPVGGVISSVTVPNGIWNHTFDAGFYLTSSTGSIGDRVWFDADGNGIQGPTETGGITGVTVQLRNSAGTVIQTTTTNGSGNYLFTGLPAGNYTVVFPVSISGAVVTTQAVGADRNIDSDPSQTTGITGTIVLGAGQNITNVDAGYCPTTLALGDHVFEDLNNNGVRDAAEVGIANVTVNLYKDDNNDNIPDGAAIATQITSATGSYLFSNLSPGNYIVGATPPAGLTSSTNTAIDPDNDVDVDDNGTNLVGAEWRGLAITLVAGTENDGTTNTSNTNITYDFGFFKPATIGNFVWNDTNNNGIQDGTETGIGGVTVRLTYPDGVTTVTTTTAANGSYSFTNLLPGTYSISFTTPAGYTASPSNLGGNDNTDSDPIGGVVTGIVLTYGQTNNTIDAGFTQNTLNLGNFVWYDKNNNGTQDAGEPGVVGAVVNLYRDANGDNVPDGAAVATYTTIAGGSYTFGSLAPGNYIVGVVLPTGYVGASTTATSATPNNDDNTDNNGVTTVGSEFRTNFITLSVNGEPTTDGDGNNGNLTLDLGIRGTGSIGDFVWRDANNNGIQDPGEPGISGVVVTLTFADGSTVSTTTNATGGYSFTNLVPGTYSVSFATPPAYTPATANQGGDDTKDSDPIGGIVSGIVLTAGQNNTTIDAGFVPVLGSIGNRVWMDINKNGVQDGTEVGVANVTVSLYDNTGALIATTVTDGLGNYKFNNLPVSVAGINYQVAFTVPAEYVFTGLNANGLGITDDNNSDANTITGRSGNITLTVAAPNAVYADAGLFYTSPNKIGDFIWNDLNKNGQQDAGEPGIAGVTVTLYNSAGVAVRTTITDNNGYYKFEDVIPGTYTLGLTQPVGYTLTTADLGADATDNDFIPSSSRTAAFTVTATTNDLSFDGGLVEDATTKASVGDKVWNDINGNNLQDADETGVAGVTVQLYNASNVLVATTTTDAFGNYIFNNLNPGTYYVKFSNLPAGYALVTPTVGTDRSVDSDVTNVNGAGTTAFFSLNADQNRTDIDAGIRNANVVGSLGDKVWYDLNKNGIQDAGEAGVPGVTVYLYNATTNALLKTTTTDGNGLYLFNDLSNGTYVVGFGAIPSGYDFTTADATTDDADSDVNPNTNRTGVYTINTAADATRNIRTVDAGIVSTPNHQNSKGSIGDKVWNDINNNGQQDAGEPGVSGVTVTLYSGPGVDGIWGNSDDVVYGTTTTDGLGNYIFTNLPAGDYQVGFTKPAGFNFGTANTGNDNTDSDADITTGRTSVVTLLTGEVNLTLDAGITAITPKSNLGDKVWFDLNNNGVQDATEPGVLGVTVTLYDAATGAALKTTSTDVNGSYLFTGLDAGNYVVGFSNYPSGYTPTGKDLGGNDLTDSDADPLTGKTGTIALAANTTNLTVDLGIVTTAKAALGDYVWIDANANGIQDATELPAPGVTVTLYNSANVAVATTVTDANGKYLFTNLDPGTYTVGFSNLPINSSFTGKNSVGSNNANGSDVNQATGKTDPITLVAGQVNTDVDAGLVSNFAAVGNYVWFDVNGDGVQNDGAANGVPGITVILKDQAGNVVASAVTDGKGFYFINNIPVPAAGSSFFITFSGKPTGSNYTVQNSPLGNTDNTSDALPSTGSTGLFTLVPGQIRLDIDAGLTKPASLPVNLISFNGALSANTAKLNWVVTNEISLSHYELERSLNGSDFAPLTSVTARGNANGQENYNYNDNVAGLGASKIYYRLRIVDRNGDFKYSNIVIVRLNGIKISNIYPNPFVDFVKVEMDAATKEIAQVRVIDLNGKVIVSKAQQLQVGGNQFMINGLAKLPRGTYIMEVTTSTEKLVEKLTKN